MTDSTSIRDRAVEVLAAHTITSGYDWNEESYSYCRCGAGDVGPQHQADALDAAGLLAAEYISGSTMAAVAGIVAQAVSDGGFEPVFED